ncbi:unnamed protein product [Pelagomonas calceolata]|uniref:peptidylprolyl isomerase n=1 Tax=Pelagomonas calceolata TaxID=35677 RepID=A0A8J2SRT2_9STRA|nr:unnamed protein product [Pelagomonas calceolata]
MAAQLAKDRPRAYLDFDVDDACAKFKRASHFVESCDLKYALSSKKIDELGGGEVLRLPELYANDYEWSSKGPMRARPQPNCRVVFELYGNIAPLAVENFLALCRGDRGVDKGSGVKLHYANCPVHRVVKGFVMQGGDIVKGNGSGGASCFGKKFKDETKGLRLQHDAPGVLSMGNSGKNSNSSQFFVTLAPVPQLDGKHVVFGRVIAGMDVVRAVEAVAGEGDEKPRAPVVVCACGVFEDDTPPRGHWAPASVDTHAGAPPSFVPAPTLVLVVGPTAAADRARAALTAAHLRADVVAAPDPDASAAHRVDRRAVVLVTPGASPDAAARAEALAGERGWSVVTAKPARCAEAVASML